MAKNKGKRDQESPDAGDGSSDDSEFDAGQFEDIDLDLPDDFEEDDDSEFEDAGLDALSAGIQNPPERLLAAKEQLEQSLLFDLNEQALSAESDTEGHGPKNIQGVGISEKMIDGQFTGELAVTVYVMAKHRKGEVEAQSLVPESVGSYPTDVVAVGELNALPFRGRYRPAPGGVSVGHFKITAGTIGCLVRRGKALYILSNNHVLANVNTGAIGDPILQPGPFDGGQLSADVIAKLSKFVPIQLGGPPNDVDCAIAQTSPRLVVATNKCYGRINPRAVDCRLNLMVKKCGRTTQFTRGRITDCNFTGRIGFGTSGFAVFRNQIVITSLTNSPFSAGGDSGSLIVTDRGNRPVGLLFAGSASHTIANPIKTVLSALGVSIVA